MVDWKTQQCIISRNESCLDKLNQETFIGKDHWIKKDFEYKWRKSILYWCWKTQTQHFRTISGAKHYTNIKTCFSKQSTLHWMSPHHNKSIINHCTGSQYVRLTNHSKKRHCIHYSIYNWVNWLIHNKEKRSVHCNQ